MIGVEPEAAPTLTRALEAGKPVDAPPAGGDRGGFARPAQRVGELMFPIARAHIARVLLVSRRGRPPGAGRALGHALRWWPSPAAPPLLGALATNVARAGERVGVVVSGGNTTAVDFDR